MNIFLAESSSKQHDLYLIVTSRFGPRPQAWWGTLSRDALIAKLKKEDIP